VTERWVCPVEHDQMRPVVISRFWMLTGNDRTLRSSVRSLRSSASGHHLTIGIGRSVFEEWGHMACIARPDAKVLRSVDMTRAFGHPVLHPVKGYNGSILWRLLFKPCGQLKLTLLAICIDIAILRA
jgi:hypothetical protein